MIFSSDKIKRSIKDESIVITPFSADSLREASYILHLALPAKQTLLAPGEFMVVQTIEKLTLSQKVACFITTPGSIARQGMDVVQSDIFCEPLTDQHIYLQLTNASSQNIELICGMNIAKAIFVSIE